MNNIQVSFNLTGRCNLACTYCAVRGGEIETIDTKPETIMKAYKEIRGRHPNSHLDLNCMGNGEPLLNWRGIETVDKIKTLDDKVKCFVTTNGTHQNKILDLANRNWIITVSYDGLNNDFQRGKKLIVEDTIKKLGKINAKFLVRMTITPESLEYLDDSLDYIRGLDIKYVVIGPVFPFGRFKDKKLENFFNLKKIHSSLQYAESIGLRPLLTIQESCTLATRGYYVLPDGRLSACYIEYKKPNKRSRDLAKKRGCLITPYKNPFNEF